MRRGGLVLSMLLAVLVSGCSTASPPEQSSSQSSSRSSGNPFGLQQPAMSAAEYFVSLVKAIPEPAVQDTILHLLRTKQLMLNIDPELSIRGVETLGSLMLVSEQQPYQFIMGVNPNAAVHAATDSVMDMLVVYHEYQHLEQVRSGRYPAAGFLPGARVETLQQAHTWVKAELDAYIAECRLADRINYKGDFDLLHAWRSGKEAGVREWMFQRMAETPGAYPYLEEVKKLFRD